MTLERHISARDNPLLQRLRRLVQDPGGYRRAGAIWIEGEHLCTALRARGWSARQALLAGSAAADPARRALAGWADELVTLPDRLFATLSALPSPAGIGFVIDLPPAATLDPLVATVVLDRVQDAGNVGSILRSAAAFGVAQVLALTGTAALWSPKVLRAGQGAHFGLRLCEGLSLEALQALRLPLVAASAQGGEALPQALLPAPCAWVFGHEGQGLDAALLARCARTVRIPQPGGEESLNVAAAAAVCLYEGLRQRSR